MSFNICRARSAAGNIHRDKECLVPSEQLRTRSPAGLVLVIDIRQRLLVVVAPMKHAEPSSIDQGGGKRRGEGIKSLLFGAKIPPMIRAVLIFAYCIAVAACATEQKIVWSRTDGRPVVQALLEIDQTDCHDEGQKKTDFLEINDKAKPQRAQSKSDQFAACMAEHGYLATK